MFQRSVFSVTDQGSGLWSQISWLCWQLLPGISEAAKIDSCTYRFLVCLV